MNQSPSIDWWRREPVADVVAKGEGTAVKTPSGPWAFRGLVAFTVVLILAPQAFMPILEPLRIALLAAGLAVVSHLVDRWGRGLRVPGGRPRELVLVGCLLVWSMLTVPLSIWPSNSLNTLTDTYVKSVAVFWLLAEVVNTPKRLRTLLWTLSVLSVPLAVTGVRHFASGAYGAADRIAGYASGVASNPNDLALTLDLLIPITAVLVLNARRVAVKMAGGAILAVCVMAVVATFSRGGFLALAVEAALFIFVLARRRAWTRLGVAVLLVGLAMPLLPASYGDRLATIASINSDPTGSSQERWRDTLAAVQYVRTHPVFGAGLGNDVLALNEIRGATWTMVHNAYLDYAVDLGLVGLILYVSLVASSILTARSVERQPPEHAPEGQELSTLATGVRISLMAFAAAAFFYPVAYHFYFYYFAGLALALRTCRAGLAGGQPAV
jgi:O-antigen ligase